MPVVDRRPQAQLRDESPPGIPPLIVPSPPCVTPIRAVEDTQFALHRPALSQPQARRHHADDLRRSAADKTASQWHGPVYNYTGVNAHARHRRYLVLGH